jgi:xanthine dehydrogenase accessory factor
VLPGTGLGGHAGSRRATTVITDALALRAEELAAQGAPFVTATVVRAQRPTSVQAGNVALVTTDGSIQGFVGGVCAEHSVRLYSLKVLESGEALLLKILPDGPKDIEEGAGYETDREEGSITVQNPCLSGGAIEVFLEPILPQPRVLLVGHTPIAEAVAELAPALGLKVHRVDGNHLEPQAGDLALVVAAHGRDELETVRGGLEAGLPYVGLVASPKRGNGLVEELRADGVSDDLLGQIDFPAGIEIGAVTPAEIGLSLLAKIVQVRRGGSYTPAYDAAAAAPATAIDPICGMTVIPGPETPKVEHDGETLYFCRVGCKDEYEKSQSGAEAPAPTAAPTTAIDPICGMTVVVDADTPRVEHDGETVYFCCAGCRTKFEKEHLHAVAAH